MSNHTLKSRSSSLYRARRCCLSVGCLVLLTLGCNGTNTVYEVVVSGGAPGVSAGAGAPASAGMAASSGGNTAGGSAGEAARGGGGNTGGVGGVAGALGGMGGVAGVAGVAGTGIGGVAGVAGTGAGGGGGSAGLACGALIAEFPPDCFAMCASTRVVDQNNVPVPTNVCIEGTCDAAGNPGSAPAPLGTACSAAGGGIVCDGEGKCVPCVHASDCPAGQVCSAANQCVPGACTDVNCGGTCAPCAAGKKCLADADCVSFACDVVSLTCVTPQCQDHQQDGVETDADCGGGFCPTCPLGEHCALDSDCKSQACDAVTLSCVSDSCADHHANGTETDVDCGGGTCKACSVGQKCKSSFDCQGGHFCSTLHVCQ